MGRLLVRAIAAGQRGLDGVNHKLTDRELNEVRVCLNAPVSLLSENRRAEKIPVCNNFQGVRLILGVQACTMAMSGKRRLQRQSVNAASASRRTPSTT